jgi:two-component system sensor histidine kinase/response regulator
VSDTGLGIDPAARPYLLDPFTQADASTTRRFGGTGLGLAISRQLIELMGGFLDYESEVGTGSIFWFEIPLRLPAAASARGALPGPGAPDRPGTDQAPAGVSPAVRLDALSPRDLPEGVLAHLPRLPAAHPGTGPVLDGATDRAGLAGWPAPASPAPPASRPPAAPPAAGQPPLAPPAAPPAGAGPLLDGAARRSADRALVVDDSPINQLVAKDLLEGMGLTVDVAASGMEAIRAAATHGYDLIFMDCLMPVMDGFEATRQIRLAEEPGHRTPIVAITAAAMDGDRERCLAAGMDDYVTKPVTPQALSGAVSRYCRAPAQR